MSTSNSNKEIKFIYICGTSFTAGGGFEEGNETRNIVQKYTDEKIPEKMEDCSWPGMLKKHLNNKKIKVINKAVPGAGIEYLINTTKEWIDTHPTVIENTLFLLELSGYGRNLHWCNRLKKPVHVNWDYGVQSSKFWTSIHTGNYWNDNISTINTLKNLEPLMKQWYDEFKNPISELRELQLYFFNFMTWLNYKGITFKIFGEQFIDPEYRNDKLNKDNYMNLYHNNIKPSHSIYSFLIEEKLQISTLTKGESNDFHATLEGNREVARQYYDYLSKHYNI